MDTTKDDIDCVACGYTSQDESRFKLTTAMGEKVMMCNVCRNSKARFAYCYPMQYLGIQEIIFNTSLCTNMIIDNIITLQSMASQAE